LSVAGLVAVGAWSLCCAWEDWRKRRISNPLIATGVATAILWQLVATEGPLGVTIAGSLAGVGLALLVTVSFYWMGMMGGGDVKFLAVLGYLGGFTTFLFTIALGALLQLIVASALHLSFRRPMGASQPLALTHGPVFIGVVLWRHVA